MDAVSFNAFLEPVDEIMVHHLIPVPDEIAHQFVKGKRAPRILCSISGNSEFACALNPRHGRYVIIASLQLIKQNRLAVGLPFSVSIRIDPHNGLELPAELAEVLSQDDFANQVFESLNDGHKRGLLYYVRQAKTLDTRIKRSIEIMEKMKTRFG